MAQLNDAYVMSREQLLRLGSLSSRLNAFAQEAYDLEEEIGLLVGELLALDTMSGAESDATVARFQLGLSQMEEAS